MFQPFFKLLSDNPKSFCVQDFAAIGKDPQCQIHIDNPLTAERHARIEKKDQGYLIRDLRSVHGTFVNDARILEAIIKDGDILRIGDQELIFIENDPRDNEFSMRSRNEIWNQELQGLSHVSKTEFPVLILGPSGTGKDVIASNLHDRSQRQRGPFVSVNCSALSETLIESELFGHIKGSFTGAINDRKGAFEAARGGTLFLDEIGDLSYSLQAKLLRALENNEIRPVGSDKNIKTDVRVIAATHQNLREKIHAGAFRADLYFRLNVISISPPALSLRMEDFEDLLYTFAKALRVRFSFGAISRLKKHSWPGNIRELKNLVTRAAAIYPKELITEEHVEKLIDRTLIEKESDCSLKNFPVIKEIEKQMIVKRLSANQGNQRRTAQDLGMPKSTLHDRLRYYNIDVNNYKL
jgi:DNA-binding NtrC family response regulator